MFKDKSIQLNMWNSTVIYRIPRGFKKSPRYKFHGYMLYHNYKNVHELEGGKCFCTSFHNTFAILKWNLFFNSYCSYPWKFSYKLYPWIVAYFFKRTYHSLCEVKSYCSRNICKKKYNKLICLNLASFIFIKRRSL